MTEKKTGQEQAQSINEFEARARRKKKSGGLRDDRRIVRLPALPERVWATRRLTLAYEQISYETFGIARPEDEIAPGHRGYQREEVTTEVGELADVMRRGGATEPIHAVHRAWERSSQKRKLWIVDGQQRMWAALDAGKGLVVLIHDVETPQEERALFDAFNNRRRVNANLRIWNHDGPASELLISENRDAVSPLYQRISFGSPSKTRLSANTVLRCLAVVAGSSRAGDVGRLLTTLDHYITKGGRKTCQEFLRALGLVFLVPPPGLTLGHPQLIAFAKACRAAGCPSDARTITKLRKVAAGLPAVVAATYQERIDLMLRRLMRVFGPRVESGRERGAGASSIAASAR